jgi:hypothetical protein
VRTHVFWWSVRVFPCRRPDRASGVIQALIRIAVMTITSSGIGRVKALVRTSDAVGPTDSCRLSDIGGGA